MSFLGAGLATEFTVPAQNENMGTLFQSCRRFQYGDFGELNQAQALLVTEPWAAAQVMHGEASHAWGGEGCTSNPSQAAQQAGPMKNPLLTTLLFLHPSRPLHPSTQWSHPYMCAHVCTHTLGHTLPHFHLDTAACLGGRDRPGLAAAALAPIRGTASVQSPFGEETGSSYLMGEARVSLWDLSLSIGRPEHESEHCWSHR